MTFAQGLPLPVAYKTAAVGNPLFNFSAKYALDGRTLKVTRVFRTTNEQKPCKSSAEAILTKDLQKVGRDTSVMMQFVRH